MEKSGHRTFIGDNDMMLIERSGRFLWRSAAALAVTVLVAPIADASAADTVLWLNGTESVVPSTSPPGSPGAPISVLQGAYGTNVVTVKYPASFWPLTAAADPTGPVLGVSVDEGIANLHKAIGCSSGTVAVIGTSQGSLVVDDVQDDLGRLGGQPEADLTFVATADPQGGTGVFTVLFPTGTHIPVLEYDVRAAPVDTAFDRVDITYQYDGVGNFPDRPWHLLATVNAILGGLYLHPLTQWADLSTVPDANIITTTNSKGATLTTYLVPAPYLPLTRPLEQLGVPTGIVHALNSVLVPIINKGYSTLTPDDGPHLSHGQLVNTTTATSTAKASPRSITADPEPAADDDDQPAPAKAKRMLSDPEPATVADDADKPAETTSSAASDADPVSGDQESAAPRSHGSMPATAAADTPPEPDDQANSVDQHENPTPKADPAPAADQT